MLKTSNCKWQEWQQAILKGDATCHWKCSWLQNRGKVELVIIKRNYQKLSWGRILPPKMQTCSQRCSGMERHFGALPESSLIRTCINDTRQKRRVGCGSNHPKLSTWGTVSYGDRRDSCCCSHPRARKAQKMVVTAGEGWPCQNGQQMAAAGSRQTPPSSRNRFFLPPPARMQPQL